METATVIDELAQVLEDIQNADSFRAAAHRLTSWARAFTGCQGAVLRLLADDGNTWLAACALDGHSPSFVRDEVLVHTTECICGHVAIGAFDSSLPFLTPNGSFVCESLSTFPGSRAADELRTLRGRCLQEGYESLAVIPVKARGKPIGSLHLADSRPHAFDERITVVESVCRLAGHELLRHRSRERDQVLLETIGLSLLPASVPEAPGLEAGVAIVSATELAKAGGDFYDVYDLGAAGVLLVVGDVSGRGLEALGIATQVRYTIQAQVTANRRPAQVLGQANQLLVKILPERRFVTIALCLVDPTRRSVTVCLAGHPPPVVAHRGGARQLGDKPNGPLGVFEDLTFSESSHRLEPGETLILYTDGVTEARKANKLFGLEGLCAVAQSVADRHPQEVADSVCHASLEFHDPQLPADDRLVLAVRLRR
ncbi:MAG: SpoIIE family protein phosphatase [Thermoleophilia bacterium]|nr:SpoIIE family protein phosphatase [Thermoleophilia bacterium]